MSNPILYQSLSRHVILLDLPRSIEDAQSTAFRTRSASPPDQPRLSTEPKGSKYERLLAAIPSDELQLHRNLQHQIQHALAEIKTSSQGPNHSWCYPRYDPVYTDSAVPNMVPHGMIIDWPPKPLAAVILSSTEDFNAFNSLAAVSEVVVLNPRKSASSVIEVDGNTYFIPPEATFVWSSVQAARTILRSAADTLLPATAQYPHPGRFDLILMDPPWSNRSVRHACTYATAEHQHADPFLESLPIVWTSLAAGGMVATWITNKSAVRVKVIKSFQDLDLTLHEEWLWVKTTIKGEPVTAIDGIWRKPYENLLVFRQGCREGEVLRRVIAAVPDFHSRKPSLKRLFEEYLPSNYRALELFARSLTKGWWSVGDEVLKFQHKDYWQCN